jgi:mono/diheme cytochrome c family protein
VASGFDGNAGDGSARGARDVRRRARILAIVLAVLFIAGLFAFTSMIRKGFSAHDEPTRLEVTAARALRHWATPAALRDMKNPLPVTPEVLSEARAHFADHCAVCHGNDGKGESGMGKTMYPRTPDFTQARTQNLSDGELFSIIENGVRLTGMPGFGSGTAESGQASWMLVHFVRHLPQLTAAELEEMETLNPKSPEEWQQIQDEAAFLDDKTTTTEGQN